MKREAMNKEAIIEKYKMIPHEEGGYYAEICKLNNGAASQIYYLLDKGETAKWHRLGSEELWLFHSGSPLIITLGGTAKEPKTEISTVIDHENPSFLIPQNHWQMAEAKEGPVLVSCIVCPAFTWEEWELYPKEKF